MWPKGRVQRPPPKRGAMLEDRGLGSHRSKCLGRGLAGFAGWVMLVCLMVGCGGPARSQADRGPGARPDAKRAEAPSDSREPAARPPSGRVARQRVEPSRGGAAVDVPSASIQKERQEEEEEPTDQWPEPQRVRSLTDLLEVRDSPSVVRVFRDRSGRSSRLARDRFFDRSEGAIPASRSHPG